MKKTVIALAALAASSAFAQSSVTMYGRIDLGWGTATTKSKDGTSIDKSVGLVDGTQTSNAIGFRGTEDLGGGLTAGFNLEQGISPASSNGWNLRKTSSAHQTPNGGAFAASTMRAGNISLRSAGMGLLEFGTLQWSVGYNVASKAIVLSEDFGGEAHALVMPSRITGLSWTSPAFSGATLTLQHGGAHGARTDRFSASNASDGFLRDENTRTGISLQYATGPLYLGAAYESTAVTRVSNSAATTNAYGGTVGAGTAQNSTEKALALGASYDFGAFKVNYTFANRDNGVAAAAKKKWKNSNFSVSAPVGPVILAAHMTDYDVSTGGAKSTDVSGSQIGARYNLSKRTNLYVFSGRDADKAVAATVQSKRSRTVAGIVHTF